MQESRQTRYSFGPFVLDAAEKLLFQDEQPVHLPPKAFDTLLTLVQNDGHLVEKGDLLNRVWPNTFVEEATLSQNIFVLRKALANGGNGHEYIETIPKRGYRFVGSLNGVSATQAQEGNTAAPSAVTRVPRTLKVAAAAALLILVTSLLAWRAFRSPSLPTPSKSTLAVLPLVNLSGDSAQDYFCDGLTEQLLTDFGTLNPDRLGVIARTTMMRYKNTRKDVSQIGQELKADYVLEGSVARENEHVRVDAQLIRVQDQTHIWAHSYERDLGGTLALQDDVASAIAGAVSSTLTPSLDARKMVTRTLNPAAYEAYLQGRFFWNKRSEQGHLKAIGFFNEAIRNDPSYAQAYSGLADAYALLASNANRVVKRSEAMEKARAAALKALAIDDTLAEAHTSLAFVYWHYDWNWPAAEKQFQRALQLNPSYATAHQWFAFYLLSQGRVNESLEEIRTAERMDPLSLIINTDAAQLLFFARRYDEAREQARKVLEMDARFSLAREILAWCMIAQHQYEAALVEAKHAVDTSPDPDEEIVLAITCAAVGDKQTARSILARLAKQPSDPFSVGFAQAYAALGEKDQAFAALENALKSRNGGLTLLRVLPFLDSLQADPRFTDLARRISLP